MTGLYPRGYAKKARSIFPPLGLLSLASFLKKRHDVHVLDMILSGQSDHDMPEILKAIKPDIVGVSAGFDGYIEDRLLGLKYTRHAFYECAYRLKKSFRKTPVFAVLEGGYHYEIRELVNCFIEGIDNGSKPPKIKFSEDMAIG